MMTSEKRERAWRLAARILEAEMRVLLSRSCDADVRDVLEHIHSTIVSNLNRRADIIKNNARQRRL